MDLKSERHSCKDTFHRQELCYWELHCMFPELTFPQIQEKDNNNGDNGDGGGGGNT